jgi:hypothetical protein
MMMMILEVGITEIPTFFNEREKYGNVNSRIFIYCFI